MPGFFSYYSNLIRHRGFHDFLSMGYGIEARSKRCREYWHPHLELSKSFIRTHLPAGTVLIAGSGRLFDYPSELLKSAERTTLLDADPASLSYCRKKYGENRISYLHTEITGSIREWERRLRQMLRRSPEAAAAVEVLNSLSPEHVPITQYADTVVSLNILGQIPVYWRERVKNILATIDIHPDTRDEFPLEIESALKNSCGKLQRTALKTMIDSAGSKCIILTDLYYHYYEKNHAEWQTHDALYFNPEEILGDLSLGTKESWLWHVAPQGIESKDHGIIHEVHAYSFSI